MKNENLSKWAMWFCIGIAIILVSGGIFEWWCGHQAFFGKSPSTTTGWGDFGSFLQGTTALLWSLAGFFIILVAFLAQKQQLSLQQRQFSQQSFENHFFQLLTFNRNIVDNLLLLDDSEVELKGSRVFSNFYRRVEYVYQCNVEGPVEQDTEALAVKCYTFVFDQHPEVLGHYFRSLYHVIKFVNESEVTDKKRYTSIVRAQLSSFEHVLLHYNGLSEYGETKFKRLIQDFALLENMGPGLLLNPKHPTSYSPKAFGDDAASFVFGDGPAQVDSPILNGPKPSNTD
jgi:hypothetical protein